VLSSDCAVIVALSCWPSTVGRAPNAPAEICAFCAATALTTSAGAISKAASLDGSSQIRMAYSAPKTRIEPTPSTRLSSSTRLDDM